MYYIDGEDSTKNQNTILSCARSSYLMADVPVLYITFVLLGSLGSLEMLDSWIPGYLPTIWDLGIWGSIMWPRVARNDGKYAVCCFCYI